MRARSAAQVLPHAEALISGGMKAIEITFTTPDAPKAIREVHSHFGESAVVGAGTILKEEQLEQAIDAGARFAVSPILRPDLVKPSHVAGCPIMLGAYSPTEAQRAFEAGSDMVKIFPADTLGPAFIKALRAHCPTYPSCLGSQPEYGGISERRMPCLGCGFLTHFLGNPSKR